MLDTAAPPELLKQLRIYPGSMRTQRALFSAHESIQHVRYESRYRELRRQTECCESRLSGDGVDKSQRPDLRAHRGFGKLEDEMPASVQR